MSATNPLKALFDHLRRWHARRTAIRHVKSLDARLLRDVGIERHEIEAVVTGHHAAYGNRFVNPLRHDWRLYNMAAIVHPLLLGHAPKERGRL